MRRRFVPAVLLIALILVAASCAGGEEQPTSDGGETTTVKVGYIPGPAPAAALLVAEERGYFAEQGIELEATTFQTGISLSNALTGGSIDLGVMGAVIANFPARGQGKAFLINNLETNIHQIWAAPGSGVSSVKDLKGKKVATTTGTAAHLMLQVALEENGLSTSDVEIVNLDMPAVANTFATGGVPVAALWAPFDEQAAKLEGATRIATAEEFLPDAAIAGGWVANNQFYVDHKDALKGIVNAWLKANTDLLEDTDAALEDACAGLAEFMDEDTCRHIYDQTKSYPNDEWATYYQDGTAIGWIGRMEQVFVDIGALPEYVEPGEFFDTSIYLDAYQSVGN